MPVFSIANLRCHYTPLVCVRESPSFGTLEGVSLLRQQFGRNLRRLRLQQDWTQEQMAERLGTSVNFLSFMERGMKAPSFENLERIGEVLGWKSRSCSAFQPRQGIEASESNGARTDQSGMAGSSGHSDPGCATVIHSRALHSSCYSSCLLVHPATYMQTQSVPRGPLSCTRKSPFAYQEVP